MIQLQLNIISLHEIVRDSAATSLISEADEKSCSSQSYRRKLILSTEKVIFYGYSFTVKNNSVIPF